MRFSLRNGTLLMHAAGITGRRRRASRRHPCFGIGRSKIVRTLKIVLLALPCAAVIAGTAPAWAAAPAEIISVQGKGEYRDPAATNWKDAIVRQPIGAGNFVRTGDASRMAVLLADQTQIRLAANSMMQIKEVGDGKQTDTVIKQSAGRSWTQSKSVPNHMTVETPTALAAIRGTDWELTVEEDGRSTLTVLSGEIAFSNEQGAVSVAAGEQAVAEQGRAPVKRLIVNPADRVQWVGSWTVDPARYANIAVAPDKGGDADLKGLKAVIQNVSEARLDAALKGLEVMLAKGTSYPETYLLYADFMLYQGEPARAVEFLRKGEERFSADPRLDAMLVRAWLYAGKASEARVALNAGKKKHPQSFELLLAEGEVARLEGNAHQATAAYFAATAREPGDARGWYGLGVVESEKDDLRKARKNLLKAVELADDGPGYRASLGLVHSLADNLVPGRAELQRALTVQPDDYVALTALGLTDLKAGDIDGALRSLLGASVIEPRYVPAHIYTAIAYYQQGRIDNALFELKRASSHDDKDPLPYLLASLIDADLIRPAAAIDQAREALKRMPFLKSLNQVANDQKGAANLGSALALFGMEDWSQSYAQESYYPFWAGSHLFLSDRYPGQYDKNSELLQGFMTDPTVFGASNRFQTLLPKPGTYVSLATHMDTSKDGSTIEPDLTVNGYANDGVPLSYFLEAVRTQVNPRNVALEAIAPSYTAAFGIKPTHEFGLFAYINDFHANAKIGLADQVGEYDTINGRNTRGDFGAHYEFSPQSQVWLKFGVGREDATLLERQTYVATTPTTTADTNFTTQPHGTDWQLRHTFAANDQHQVTWGYAYGRSLTPSNLAADAYLSVGGAPVPVNTVQQDPKDRSDEFYVSDRYSPNDQLTFEGALTQSHYRKNRDVTITRNFITYETLQDIPETLGSNELQPRAGMVYRFQPDQLFRIAYQRWTRPTTFNTISPIATAGIPVDDQIVFAGGRLTRTRAQLEWAWSHATFTRAFVDYKQVNNLNSPLDGVQNTGADLEQLEALRNRTLNTLPSADLLEGTPIFSQGRIPTAGFSVDHIFNRWVSLGAGYQYADGRNTNPLYQNNAIPYIPKQRVDLTATWTNNNRFYVTLQAIYRSQRYTDEANTLPLAASWDGLVRAYWESANKRWVVEGYAQNLAKRGYSDLYGLNLTARY
jgi:Flp pilus assembly protein TadD